MKKQLILKVFGIWYIFDVFSLWDVYDFLRLCQDIFVLEQSCFYGDIDGKDLEYLYYLLCDIGIGVLVGVIWFFVVGDGFMWIGCVVVVWFYCGQGFGWDLMLVGFEKVC